MDLSVSQKDEIWFLRVCHHIATGRRFGGTRHIYVQGTKQQTALFAGTVQLRYCNLTILQARTIFHICIVSVTLANTDDYYVISTAKPVRKRSRQRTAGYIERFPVFVTTVPRHSSTLTAEEYMTTVYVNTPDFTS